MSTIEYKIEVKHVDCPKCHNEGPHERLGVDMSGMFIVAQCRQCELTWHICGPEKWSDE